MKLLRKLTAFVSAAAVAATGAGFGGYGGFTGFGLTAFAEDYAKLCGFELTGSGYTIEEDLSTTSSNDYLVRISDGAKVTIKNKNSGKATNDHIEVESGANAEITLAGVNIGALETAALRIADDSSGNVTITLADDTENILTGGIGFAGLQKNGGTGTLTINGGENGTGTLNAKSMDYGAGIGSAGGSDALSPDCANIVINGGNITASGGQYAAGIGGGGSKTGTGGSCSNIKINGGIVNATGYLYAAGIGGGGSNTGTAGNCSGVEISGGSVTAKGGSLVANSTSAAGIGGGGSNTGAAGSCSTVKISGGIVSATGNLYGAGIGGGGSEKGAAGTCTDINITDGDVTANGGSGGAGIGGGRSDEDTAGDSSYITISGGVVNATGGEFSAGIGGGGSMKRVGGTGANITISDGKITATGGEFAAGIGSGGSDINKGGSADVTISGGIVIATGNNGAGIGGGDGSSDTRVTISDGTVTALNYMGGPAIGASRFGFTSKISYINITGGSVKTFTEKNGYYPIGNGFDRFDPTNANGEKVYPFTFDNTGDYPVKVDGEDYSPINHKAADSSDSNLYLYLTEGKHTVQFLIGGNWLLVPYVTPPVPVESLQYSGAPQELVTAGTTTAGTLVYSLEENGVYSTDIPTGTEPGSYTVWYKVEATDKNIGTSPKSVEALISNELLSISAADGSKLVKGTDYSYENSVLTVLNEKSVVIRNRESGSSDHSIAVAPGVSANITLAGVDIDVSAKENSAALLIEDGGTGIVTITLADGTTNILKSGPLCAGVQKNDDNITLVIDGNGSLESKAGMGGAGIGGGLNGSGSNIIINSGNITSESSASYDRNRQIVGGAGIGGGCGGDGSHITINGGTVSARSLLSGAGIGGGDSGKGSFITINDGDVKAICKDGAGIGGGSSGSGSAITINGGTVTAEAHNNGAGIGGGGSGGSGANITINGGIVTATASNNGAGIGGGYEGTGSNITISGGVVTAASGAGGSGIGGGRKADGSNIVISGGSVKAAPSRSDSNAIGGGSGNAAVTPTNGTENVYLLKIDNPNGYAVTIDGVKYPTHDDKKVYAYLIAGAHTVRVGTSVKIYTYDVDAGTWTAGQELTAPEVVSGLVYDGNDHELLVSPTGAAGLTTLYSNTRDGDYSATIPTGRNADIYTLWYKIMDGDDLLIGPDLIEAEIARRPVSVTADANDKVYGYSDPGLTYTVNTATPLVNGDYLDGELTREAGENVGDYAITQGTLTNRNNPNYDITFTAGTFTINPADISTATVEQLGTLTYNGIARTPEFTVTFDSETLTVSDFDVIVTAQKNAGDYTAEISGSGNYTGTATGDWSIGKAAATITANSYTIHVGDALPAFDYKVSGLVGRDTLPVEVTATCTTDGSTAGTFPITASGAAESNNYTFTYVNGTLTVTAKDIQTITAEDLTLTYGDSGKKITAATSGNGKISYAVATGTDVISVAADGAVTVLKAGVATVDITAAETDDYANATKTVTVNVNKVAATVAANSFTIQVGDTLPTFDYKVTGLVNGETLPVNVAVTCTAADSKTAGTFPITVSGAAESDNYTFTYVNGTLTITAKNIQTITAEDLALTYGDSGRKITAATSGDGKISYAVATGTDVISVAADGTVTILKAGTATVEITAAETADYAEATKTVTVTVNKASATVTANSFTIQIGDALPTFDYKVTGLVNGETLPFNVTVTCAAADSKTAGTFPITVSGAAESDNYAFTYVNGTLTISAKDIQTITAENLMLTYGDTNKKISAATSGNGVISYEVANGTDVIGVAADGAVTALKSGTATVKITAAETDDYTEASKVITVTVNRAAVTIKANDYTVNQGEALPAFDYTVTGLVNGDKLAFTPVLTCAVADSRTAGTYEITVSVEVTKDDRYTYATRNGTLTVKKKSSGGNSGGSSGGYRPTIPAEPNNPSIDGVSRSWSSIAADLAKLTPGSEVTIELNGNTTVPAEVIRVIAERKLKATFTVDSVKSWKTDGAEIKTPAAADLSVIPTLKLKTDALRGIKGIQLTVNSTNIPTSLAVAFKSEHAGKFANLYREVSGKLVFVTCAKLGADGKVILPGVTEKGDYAVMLCEFSDLPGDVSNDGVMNALDAGAILKDITGIELGKNPLMADFNGDGIVNAMDASAILKRIVGIA